MKVSDMKNSSIVLFFNLTLLLSLVLSVVFFYYEIYNLYLTYYIVIISTILLIYKLAYWRKTTCYNLNINKEYIFLLKLGICIFIYISPMFCLLQEKYLVVDQKISLLTFIIVTILAITGFLIDKKIFKQTS